MREQQTLDLAGTVIRMMLLIDVAAQSSGFPNLALAIVSMITSALTISAIRYFGHLAGFLPSRARLAFMAVYSMARSLPVRAVT
jgi:hypothetical protein